MFPATARSHAWLLPVNSPGWELAAVTELAAIAKEIRNGLGNPENRNRDTVDDVALDSDSQVLAREMSETCRWVPKPRAPVFRSNGDPYLRGYLIGQRSSRETVDAVTPSPISSLRRAIPLAFRNANARSRWVIGALRAMRYKSSVNAAFYPMFCIICQRFFRLRQLPEPPTLPRLWKSISRRPKSPRVCPDQS